MSYESKDYLLLIQCHYPEDKNIYTILKIEGLIRFLHRHHNIFKEIKAQYVLKDLHMIRIWNDLPIFIEVPYRETTIIGISDVDIIRVVKKFDYTIFKQLKVQNATFDIIYYFFNC